MVIILNQDLVLMDDDTILKMASFSREFESDIVPHKGDKIKTELDGEALEIEEIIIDYYENTCTVNIETAYAGNREDLYNVFSDLAESCGWEKNY